MPAQGTQVVFHLAAKAALGGPYAEFEAANVVGTQNVLRAAQAAGVRRWVRADLGAAILSGDAMPA